ncbi:cartilage intermediate layer protein 1-like [Anneissia japonica]|uniref:cartilage intermediate layer protein 1-like n=1 Tax=Anneissia japonica TaxID=1529436 RepID=UPI001425B955|nr:cartilage intermediate layer protein 1-like [Anneissia japonica]
MFRPLSKHAIYLCWLYIVSVLLGIPCRAQKPTWTPWYNRDGPGLTGDNEQILAILDENPTTMCANPVGIECQTVSGEPYTTPGENVTCSTSLGFECLRELNENPCSDYKVRFLCPANLERSTTEATQRATSNDWHQRLVLRQTGSFCYKRKKSKKSIKICSKEHA